MIREAVILAGGLGTRLRPVVDDLPKSMAPVNGKPFLYYILDKIRVSGIKKVVLATGYKSDIIRDYFGYSFGEMELVYSVEEEALGTGGAIRLACSGISGENFFVINGDTFYPVNLSAMEDSFISGGSPATVALKPMKSFERYGSVTVSGNKIISFNEKQFCKSGLINGGVYILNRKWFIENTSQGRFSIESELLEKKAGTGELTGFISDEYFIDIGIPEDYTRAISELKA